MGLRKCFRDCWVKTKKIGEEDPRRILHSIKVGLALTFVSLFYYSTPFYQDFGSSGIWAVMTVIVIFEFTFGATLSKAVNRGIATACGGALGIGAKYLASSFHRKEETAFLLALLLFITAGTATFARFFPHIKKKYDYGVVIFILTFSLVALSGYRVDKIIEFAHQRLSTIVIGCAAVIVISICIRPVWAGEDLHNQVALDVKKLANSLHGFGSEEREVRRNNDNGDDDDDCRHDTSSSILECYTTVLNSKSTEESLANYAWWEPGHGRFMFRHPWDAYLKIGRVNRNCAYQLHALHVSLTNSHNLQTSTEIQKRIVKQCTKILSESSKALKELSAVMKTMTRPITAKIHLQNCKMAVEELKSAMNLLSLEKENLLQIVPHITVASTLICIVKCVEEIAESISELSDKAHFKNSTVKSTQLISEKPHSLHRGSVKPIDDVTHEVLNMSSIESKKINKITSNVGNKPKRDCDVDDNVDNSIIVTIDDDDEHCNNSSINFVQPRLQKYH